MIQRYDIEAWMTYANDCGLDVDPDKYGEWVKWEDVKVILDNLEDLANSLDFSGHDIAEIIGREWNP